MMVDWRKSSLSQGSDHCVEVRYTEDTIFIRDSKYLRDPTNDPAAQPMIAVPAENWPDFLNAATGHHPGHRTNKVPTIEHLRTGDVTIHTTGGTTLTYTTTEWHAFTTGILLGEFTTP